MPTIDLSKLEKNKPKQETKATQNSIIGILSRDIRFGSQELSDKKKEYLYMELSSLLKAGINMKSALELISSNQKSNKEISLFNNIQRDVTNGASLSTALKVTKRFSVYESFSLQIGEETGKMVEVLQDLAIYFQNKVKQKRKIIASLTYPTVVMSASACAVFFMLKFVVPMFGEIFKRFGGQLPWITQKIIDISNSFQKYFPLIFLVFLALIILAYWKRNTLIFRRISSTLILKMPIAGNLVQKIYLARFCNSMRLLINSKLPLLTALQLSKQMIGYYPIETSLDAIINGITRGESLHGSMQGFSIYPPKMVQLLKVGEQTNQLDYFFASISEQYIEEVEYKTSALSSTLEPLIIIFLGLIVGVILIAMYLPLFQMSNNFQ